MTNHYTDFKNAGVFLMFSNVAENHPGSMQFVNEARFRQKLNPTDPGPAPMLVVDPRRTRMGSMLQTGEDRVNGIDRYLRIRPGTDIALINGIIKRHFANIDADGQTAAINSALPTGPGRYLRALDLGGHFWHDAATMNTLLWPRWSDALFRTNEGYSSVPAGAPTDYLRYGRDVTAGGANANAVADPNYANYVANPARAAFANKEQLPVIAPDLNASASGGTRTVYEVYKARVAGYDSATVADICGCDTETFEAVSDTYLANSFAYTATSATSYKAGTILYAMGTTQHTCGSANCKAYSNLQIVTGNSGKHGGGVNALRGIGNVQGSTDQALLYHLLMGYIGVPDKVTIDSVISNKIVRVTGKPPLWKHNLTGDNALNGFAGNYTATSPEVCCRVILGNSNGFIKGTASTYTYGPGAGCGAAVKSVTLVSGTTYEIETYDNLDAVTPAVGDRLFTDYETWLQAKSFGGRNVYPGAGGNAVYPLGWAFSGGLSWGHQGTFAVIRTFFSRGDADNAAGTANAKVNELYNNYLPKGAGKDHRTMVANAISGAVKGFVVWGMNPRVTCPNALKVGDGLKNLDWLAGVDMFINETYDAPRKNGGITYFLPAASFAETTGSTSNSGRWIQWRHQTQLPVSGTRTDMEILFKLARALHIKCDSVSAGAMACGYANGSTAYQNLWRDQYAGDGATAGILEGVGAWVNGISLADPATAWDNDDYRASAQGQDNGTAAAGLGKPGYAERVFIQESTNTNDKYGNAGTNWLQGSKIVGGGNYGAWHDPVIAAVSTTDAPTKNTGYTALPAEDNLYNRTQARSTNDSSGGKGVFPGFAWVWLRNRRIFYNKGGFCPGDIGDIYVAPDEVGTLFTGVPGYTNRASVVSYTGAWRGSRNMNDVPIATADKVWSKLGYTPVHTEPHETPRGDLVTAYGQIGKASLYSYADDGTISPPSGDRGNYPLTLTTFRHTEHYQGGPMSRNVPWLTELVPEAVIEINPVDAAARGIMDGDAVEVKSMRTGGNWIGPWKAVVSSGPAATQKVAAGVVAVPWHWGSAGLATGPTANELCIDALDGNTNMPESKVSLCQIQKV